MDSLVPLPNSSLLKSVLLSPSSMQFVTCIGIQRAFRLLYRVFVLLIGLPPTTITTLKPEAEYAYGVEERAPAGVNGNDAWKKWAACFPPPPSLVCALFFIYQTGLFEAGYFFMHLIARTEVQTSKKRKKEKRKKGPHLYQKRTSN